MTLKYVGKNLFRLQTSGALSTIFGNLGMILEAADSLGFDAEEIKVAAQHLEAKSTGEAVFGQAGTFLYVR